MSKNRKAFIWIASICGVFALLIFLALRSIGIVGAGGQLEEQLRLAKAEGLPVEPSDLIRPPTPENQNAAKGIMGAYSSATKLPGNPIEVVTGYTKIPTDEEIRTALETLEPTLKSVDSASLLPHFNMNLQWERGMDMTFLEFTAIRKLVRCLVEKARFDRIDGKAEQAWSPLLTAARLSGFLAEEPTILAALSRFNLETRILSEAANILRVVPNKPNSLEYSKRVRDALGPLPDMRTAMGGETVLFRVSLRQIAHWTPPPPSGVAGFSGDDDDNNAELKIASRFLRFKSIADMNDATFVAEQREVFKLLPHDETDLTRAMRDLKAHDDQQDKVNGSQWMVALKHLVPGFEFRTQTLESYASCIARRRIFDAGCEILKLASATGKFPKTWTKNGIDGIDPFTDKPLTYHRTQNGFVIYSFDRDRKDDGGRPYILENDEEHRRDISFEFPTLSVRPAKPVKSKTPSPKFPS